MSDDPRRRLGRGVIVNAGDPVPEGWADATRVPIDDAVLQDPTAVVAQLHEAWAQREPVVVDLGVDVGALRAPETDPRPPYELTPAFEFAREHCYFLARSNNYDARHGRLVWGPALEAARLGAQQGGPYDVVLPDGSAAWVDGGPRVGAPAGVDGPVVHRVRVGLGDLTPDVDASIDADLAPDQLAAVAHSGGAARIIAPAGSGKTRVLTERFRLLVARRRWGADPVCAVAYNVRAKDEMARRLDGVGAAALRKIRTLHALGFDIVRRSRAIETVLGEWEVRRRIEPLVPVRPRANTDVIAPYLEALGEVRLGLIAPAVVEAQRDDVEGFEAMFERYRRGLRDDGVVDHDEQIYGALEVLLTNAPIRRSLQTECRHLLVDEFQDLTPAQLLMLRLVAAPAYDVFGVGDDDQVIYGYAGADPKFLVDYDQYFPGAAHLQLEVNYRCPPDVVTAAANLLTYNRFRVPKTIRAVRAERDATLSTARADPEHLGAAAVDQIRRWLDGGARPADIAVLSRVRATLLAVQLRCADATIPANAPIGVDVLERTGTRAALAYLRLAAGVTADACNGHDLAIAARRPSRTLRREVLQRIDNRRRWTLASLRQLAEASTGRLDEFVDGIELLGAELAAGAGTERLLRLIRDRIGLGGALELLDRGGRGPEASHRDDLNALISVAELAPDPVAFEAWLRSVLDRPRPDVQGDEVTLSTVHRVKGMEWPYVVVLGAHDGLMPHHLADDVEEERRIFHVALTRCDTAVHLIADAGARTRLIDELVRPAPPMSSRPSAAAPSPPVSGRAGHGAEIGLELTYAGSTGKIVELRPQAALIAAHDGGNVVVPYGERVEVDARRAPLLAPPRDAVAPADEALVEALKSWRRDRAKADGVPAYVVLHDAHLQSIAAERPTSLVRLARCPGIGPTKLERYGDEIVAIVADTAS